MAQFRGDAQGNRGETHRLGSKSSGLWVRGAGWNIGADVRLSHNEDNEQDILGITIDTGNSYGAGRELAVMRVAQGMSKKEVLQACIEQLNEQLGRVLAYDMEEIKR